MLEGATDLRLSEASIAKIQPGEKPEIYVRDDKLTGFAIRARRMADQKIKRSFLVIFQERVGDKRKTTKVFIGDWKDPWSEIQARVEAQKILARREAGEVVLSSRRLAKSKRTVGDLVEEFRTFHFENVKPKTAQEYQRLLLKRIIPEFSGMQAVGVDRSMVRDWHASMRKIPYEANRALAVMSKFIRVCS